MYFHPVSQQSSRSFNASHFHFTSIPDSLPSSIKNPIHSNCYFVGWKIFLSNNFLRFLIFSWNISLIFEHVWSFCRPAYLQFGLKCFRLFSLLRILTQWFGFLKSYRLYLWSILALLWKFHDWKLLWEYLESLDGFFISKIFK